MERTQISLEAAQADLLRRLAHEQGVSMAHLIREAVDRTYGGVLAPPGRPELWERAIAAIGTGQGDGGDVSLEHDRYLVKAYGRDLHRHRGLLCAGRRPRREPRPRS